MHFVTEEGTFQQNGYLKEKKKLQMRSFLSSVHSDYVQLFAGFVQVLTSRQIKLRSPNGTLSVFRCKFKKKKKKKKKKSDPT